MNNQDAQFYLRAYRPGGRDADDPVMADALRQAELDPSLRAWFAQERAHDAEVAAKLQSITPPAGLRASILAGGRAGGFARPWWRRPQWMAMAAALVLLLSLAVLWQFGSSGPVATARAAGMLDLANHALRDLSGGSHVPAHLREGSLLAERLQASATNLAAGIDLSPEELRKAGCHTVKVGGREIFEICFKRDQYYHLYLVRREDARLEEGDEHPMLVAQRDRAALTWADERYVYVLAGAGDGQALRALL